MDAVVTYVNGTDPLWLEDYRAVAGEEVMEKRFRDWGTLKYLLRGIETFMPFVEKVHLVVSRESQVPSWVDRDRVDVVLHEQIIPGELLPVFNSGAIEMFLHRIPGLAEEFLYFNDDMFPVAPCSKEDFFRDEVAVMGFSPNLLACSGFRRRARRCDSLARKAAGRGPSLFYMRPQHIVSPMLRSECAEVFAKLQDEILSSVRPLRTRDNLTQYLFLDYMYYSGKALSCRIACKHFSLALSSAERICSFLSQPTTKMVCINDVHLSPERVERIRPLLQGAFEALLPAPSRFEQRSL